MTRTWRCLAILAVVLPLLAYAQTSPATAQPAVPRRTESFWKKLLRISGISASPSTLKAPGDEIVNGEVWQVEIGSMKAQKLASDAGYRSPIFVPNSRDVLVLKGSAILRLPSSVGKPTTLYSVNGISKLVGFSQDNASEVLILRENSSGQPQVGLLSLSSGEVVNMPFDPASMEDNHMLEHLRGWDRVYGDKTLYVKSQEKHALSGTVEYLDTFLRVGNGEPLNVTNCDGANCGQPSLSADGKRVVFIRAEPE
jgi:hypothetical protein